MAELDNVKLRLGFINGSGQQKGVDSLIVTDMIELARNRAISDAVLLSGDEDTRIGVQMAQSFGVRVHLVGIHRERHSQSLQLIHEADTTTEITSDQVASFLVVAPDEQPDTSLAAPPVVALDERALAQLPEALVAGMNVIEKRQTAVFLRASPGIPGAFDRKLIGSSHRLLGRTLEETEKRFVRMSFRALILSWDDGDTSSATEAQPSLGT